MRLFDPRLRLRHLHCLIALANHRSVNKAADALSLTPSAVSKSLAELEDITGETLFRRYRRGLELTPAGQTLLRYAAQAMGALREGLDRVGSGSRAPEHVRVGVLPTAAATVVAPAILQVQERYPHVVVTASTSTNADLLLRLKLGELDLVIGRIADPAEMTGVAFEHLYGELMALAVQPRHPLLSRARVVPGDLPRYPMILPSRGTSIRSAVDTFLQSTGTDMPLRYTETTSSSLARCLLRASDAIWFSPHGAVAPDLAAGLLRVLPIDMRFTAGSVGLSTLAARPPEGAVREFVEAVRHVAAKLDSAHAAAGRGAEGSRVDTP